MSLSERRVEILLDRAQYEQLEREEMRTGQSVAALIRDAIAARLSAGEDAKRVAVDRLLTWGDKAEAGVGEDWTDMKAAYEEALDAKFR